MSKPHDPSFSIDSVVSSNKGNIFFVNYDHSLRNKALTEDRQIFTFNGYNAGRAPVALPNVDLSDLDKVFPRCLDMPLRLAGDDMYRLPTEWLGLKNVLTQLMMMEHANNNNWFEYNTYMTVDCKYVAPEEQQRHGGLHVDGFQGARISPKNKITRNYVMTTNGGTRFYPQSFTVVDETKFNVFQGFDLQAGDFMIAEENTAYFMDAYMVHESGIAEREGLRTFLRLTYDVKRFDRAGNTHNSMIDYDWEMVERKVHETVATPSMADVLNSPYVNPLDII